MTCEEFCEAHGVSTLEDAESHPLSEDERAELEEYLGAVVRVEVERDYNADDGKGVYVHMRTRADVGMGAGADPAMALVRVENGSLFWYESQNGECMGDAEDDCVTGRILAKLYKWLTKQFPEADIEADMELRESAA